MEYLEAAAKHRDLLRAVKSVVWDYGFWCSDDDKEMGGANLEKHTLATWRRVLSCCCHPSDEKAPRRRFNFANWKEPFVGGSRDLGASLHFQSVAAICPL